MLTWIQHVQLICAYGEKSLQRHIQWAEAVSRWPSTANTRVQYHASWCGICGGYSGNGRNFSLSLSVSFHPSISFTCHRRLIILAVESDVKQRALKKHTQFRALFGYGKKLQLVNECSKCMRLQPSKAYFISNDQSFRVCVTSWKNLSREPNSRSANQVIPWI